MEGEIGPRVLPLNNFSHNGPPFFQHQFFPRSCEHVQGGKQVVSNQLSLSLDPSDGCQSPPFFEKPARSIDLRDSGPHKAEWDTRAWHWDSLLLQAHPTDRVSSESPVAEYNLETSPSKLDSGDGTSGVGLGSCCAREEPQADFLEREEMSGKRACDQTKIGSMNDEPSDDVGTLTLKLGGRSYSFLDDTESGSQNAKRCRVSSPGHQHPTCQVDGCQADLSNAKDYHRRHKVCETHSKAVEAPIARLMQRFCQQCSRFHPLEQFDEGKRSCRRRLAGHNRRRRKTQPDSTAAQEFLLAEDCTSKTAGLVNLLNIISQLQDKPFERLNDSLNARDLVVEYLRKAVVSSVTNSHHSTSGAENLNNVTMEKGAYVRGQRNDLPVVNCPTVGIHQQAASFNAEQLLLALLSPGAETLAALLQSCLKGQASPVSKTPQESLLQHLLQTHLSNSSSVQAPDFQNLNKQNFSMPPLKRTLDSLSLSHSPMRSNSSLQQRVESSSQEAEVALQNAYAKSLHFLQGRTSTNLNPVRASGSTLGANIDLTRTSLLPCTRAEESPESHAALFQKAYSAVDSQQRLNSLWSNAHSQSNLDAFHDNSYANIQDRTGRISFKLFDRNPGDFPQFLRTKILEWLSHVPSEMESYIRPGCVILTLYLSMPEQKWKELSKDLCGSLKRLLKVCNSNFWCKGRILVQMLHQIAYIVDGEVQYVQLLPASKTEIRALRPLAVIAGQRTSLVLRGRNLDDPTFRVLCAYQGKYSHEGSSWLTCEYQERQTVRCKGSEEDGQCDEKKLTFIGGSCNAIGRCFIEIETQGQVRNLFPVIVADRAICEELHMLESEIEGTSGLAEQNEACFRDGVHIVGSTQDILERNAAAFLHDLGWIFQKSFWQTNGVEVLPFQSPSCVMKRLLTFAVERDWCAVVNKLLDILFNIKVDHANVQVRDALQIIEEVNLLHKAVKRKHLSMVKLLLAYVPFVLRENLESCSSMGSSGAEKNKSYRNLLRNNYFVFTPDMAGPAKLTPLHIAASMQNAEDMVDALTSDPCKIGVNAWINAQDAVGHSPFSCALARGGFGYIKIVSEKLAIMKNVPQVTINIPGCPVLTSLQHNNSDALTSLQLGTQSESTFKLTSQDLTMTAGAPPDFKPKAFSQELAVWRPYLKEPCALTPPTSGCHQQPRKLCRQAGVLKRPMCRPFMLSMVAIAAVCVCVCLIFKDPPQIRFVLSPFTWESLGFGPR